MKKRILALMLVLILVLGALAACGQTKEETKEPEQTQQPEKQPEKEPEKEPEPAKNLKPTTTSEAENALRVAVTGMYGTFDPNRCGLDTELWVVPACYDSLCRSDGNGTILPGIGKSWEVAEDGTYVIFELRDDVYFHNGEHMTADDVVYSALRTELSTQDSYVFDYCTFEKVDDYHVKFIFKYPEEAGFDALAEALGGMAIMCKSWCEAISDDTMYDLGMQENGTGAYVLGEVNQTTRDITLKKFDKYWGDVYIDTVYLKAITGDREMAFESGDIDYASYKYDNLVNIEDYDNVYVNTEISALQYYVTPNCAKPPFDDIRVRQALCYAMDREEVGMIACNNGGVVAWSMVSATLKDFRDVNEHLDNDPDKARELMKEAGYSEANPAQCVMICRDWSLPVMEVLQERLEQCYFQCHIEMVSDSTRMWAGDFNLNCNQLILTSVQGYYALFDPDNFCTSHYVDLDLAHRIQSAQTEEELIAVQKEMNDTLAYIAICQPANFLAIDSDLEIVPDGDENPYAGLDYTLRCLRWKN